MSSSKTMLQKISTDIEKNMERVETREKYLNSQLSGLLNQYSKTQEQLKQVEDKYSKLSGKRARLFTTIFSTRIIVNSLFSQLE